MELEDSRKNIAKKALIFDAMFLEEEGLEPGPAEPAKEPGPKASPTPPEI